jgi:hypothetical protein
MAVPSPVVFRRAIIVAYLQFDVNSAAADTVVLVLTSIWVSPFFSIATSGENPGWSWLKKSTG